MSCSRSQEFLAAHKVGRPAEVVDARKAPIGREAALAMAREAEEVIACKGKNVVRLRPKSTDDTELAERLLGPTGNLRAPALRVGKTLLVGFDEKTYGEVLNPG